MNRRELIGALGVTAAGVVLPLGRAAQAADEKQDQHEKMHLDCLKACQDCEEICRKTFHHCYELLEQGKREHARAMRLTGDCAQFCDLAADMIASHSSLMAYSCTACAEACKACAEECAQSDSAEMKACAEACRACEKTCREMVKAMSAHEHH